ncbi:MAG: hypothetical protein WC275_03545 [Bacilli bacterium]
MANMHLRKTIRERNKLTEWMESAVLESKDTVMDDTEDQLLSDIKELVDKTTYEIIILRLVKNLKFKEIDKS